MCTLLALVDWLFSLLPKAAAGGHSDIKMWDIISLGACLQVQENAPRVLEIDHLQINTFLC